jgi:hypothetical protein
MCTASQDRILPTFSIALIRMGNIGRDQRNPRTSIRRRDELMMGSFLNIIVFLHE